MDVSDSHTWDDFVAMYNVVWSAAHDKHVSDPTIIAEAKLTLFALNVMAAAFGTSLETMRV